MAYGRKETALLRQGVAVGHDGEGVRLQAVVVVEARRLVPDDPRIEREVPRLQQRGALSSNPFWFRPVFSALSFAIYTVAGSFILFFPSPSRAFTIGI